MRIWMPAAAAAMLAIGAPAHGELADFDGAEIVVGAPPSYCTIGEGQFSVLGTLLLSDDPGDILLAFARCEEMDAVEAGSTDTFRHYGLVVGVRGGDGEAIRPDSALEAYLEGFDAEQFESIDGGTRTKSVGMNSDHVVRPGLERSITLTVSPDVRLMPGVHPSYPYRAAPRGDPKARVARSRSTPHGISIAWPPGCAVHAAAKAVA